MGMFDSVVFDCPACNGAVLEIQSKAGPCVLAVYSTGAVPPSVAESVIEKSTCCQTCGAEVKLRLRAPIQTVALEPYVLGDEG